MKHVDLKLLDIFIKQFNGISWDKSDKKTDTID